MGAESTFDVVIVGAGPAGSTTALALLAERPGARVVLVDRARFPREKPCAGALGERGDAILRSLGVAIDVPCVRIDGMAFRSAEGTTTASLEGLGRVVRRIEFDDALARAAVGRGAELRDGVRVEGVHDEGDAAVRVETAAGPLRARVVIGCDGVGSLVRRAIGQGRGKLRAQVVEVDTDPVASDSGRSTLVFDASDRTLPGYAWDFPTVVAGRPLMCRGVYRLRIGDGGDEAGDDRPGMGEGERHEGRERDAADVSARLDARLRAQGIDPARCKNKRYAERGFEPGAPAARGAILLAGEAAGIDPVTGEGIAQAIEYGALAGRFVARRLAESPSGAVGVEAWDRELAKSRLAFDLRIRTAFVRLFYGPARAEVERFMLESPDALLIGCEHFAARPHDWLTVGEVLGRGVARLVGHRISAALRWPARAS